MVLVVNRSKKTADSVTDFFYYMGILAHSASPTDALREVSSVYRAVLVVNPHELPDPKEFVKRIREYAGFIPIFCISDQGKKNPHADLFDEAFGFAISSTNLATKMMNVSRARKLKCIGDYRLAGFDATATVSSVYYFDTEMSLTKTEAMIFRYLIRTYPLPQSSSDILKYAFRPTRHPEQSCIKTYISIINKKFRAAEGRNLIVMIEGKGYVVYTAEMMEIMKLREFIKK